MTSTFTAWALVAEPMKGVRGFIREWGGAGPITLFRTREDARRDIIREGRLELHPVRVRVTVEEIRGQR